MDYRLKYRDILYNDEQLGPYPMEKLKRVDQYTTRVFGEIKRRDMREAALTRGARGEYGEAVKERAPLFSINEPIGAAMIDMLLHVSTVHKNPVAPERAPLPDDPRVLSRHIKSLGYFLGADIMGIGRLPQSAVYSHDFQGEPVEAPFAYAIVFVCQKPMVTVDASSGYDWIFDPVSFQSYRRAATQTEIVANYIRRLGYEAQASNFARYLTLMPQILLEAGIGESSRTGIVLNPFIGLNFKAAAVLTSMPLLPDGPVDFGLQEYCAGCTICAEACPTKSIPFGGKIEYNGYETWKLNERKCASFAYLNKNGNICGRCCKICPWNRPGTTPEDFAGWDGSLAGLYAGVDAQAERIRREGFVHETEPTRKWWFDLTKKTLEGRLEVPESTLRNYMADAGEGLAEE